MSNMKQHHYTYLTGDPGDENPTDTGTSYYYDFEYTLPWEVSRKAEPEVRKCECGAHKCGLDIHSTWCPLYEVI